MVNEDLNTPNGGDINIAQIDQNLSIDGIFQQTGIQSLARQVSTVLQLNGPSGYIYNILRKGDDFELVRKPLTEFPSKLKDTGVTQEAIQDLKRQFGRDADKVIGTIFRGISNEEENIKLFEILEAQSKDVGQVVLSDITNAEVNLFQITQKVHELILLMNSKYQRTYDAFAIIPYKPLAGILGLSQYAGAEDKSERGLFVTQIGKTKFYLNPNAESNKAYVGLKDSDNPGKCSLIFAPYQNTIISALDSDTGSEKYFLCNRFALDTSPLHKPDEEMIFKFEIV